MKNYYSILNITKNASLEDVEIAFQKLQTFTKYTGYGDDLENVRDFLELKEAYYTLRDKDSRHSYDINLITNDFEVQKKQLIKDFKIDKIQLTREFDLEKTSMLSQVKIQQDKTSEMEEQISSLLIQIDNLKNDLCKLKPIEKEKFQAIKEREITEIQNQRLLKKGREHRNNIFKIVTVLSLLFLFILTLMYINII